MANERPPKNSTSERTDGDSGSESSALQRYLAKQKQEKLASGAKDRGVPSKKFSSQKAAAPAPKSTPSLKGIERPPISPNDKTQPPTLKHWEAVADERLSDAERRAREAGAPAIPPSVVTANETVALATAAVRDQFAPITHAGGEADHFRGGEFGPRVVAYIVDMAIIGALGWPVRKVLFSILGLFFGGAAIDSYGDGLRTLITLVLIYFYYGYFYSTKAASPGKLLLGLEVYDTNGVTKLTPWKAFFRESAGKLISTIPFFMGFVIVALRADHRALHDLLFDSRVVKK